MASQDHHHPHMKHQLPHHQPQTFAQCLAEPRASPAQRGPPSAKARPLQQESRKAQALALATTQTAIEVDGGVQTYDWSAHGMDMV